MIIYRMHLLDDPFIGPFKYGIPFEPFEYASIDGIDTKDDFFNICCQPNPVREKLPIGDKWYCATNSIVQFRQWFPKYIDTYYKKLYNMSPHAYKITKRNARIGDYQVMVSRCSLIQENLVLWPNEI